MFKTLCNVLVGRFREDVRLSSHIHKIGGDQQGEWDGGQKIRGQDHRGYFATRGQYGYVRRGRSFPPRRVQRDKGTDVFKSHLEACPQLGVVSAAMEVDDLGCFESDGQPLEDFFHAMREPARS